MLKDEDSKLRRWVLTMVEVLNYHATMGRPRLGPSSLSPDQELMVTRLVRMVEVEVFLEKGGSMAPFKESQELIGSVRFDYAGEPVHYMEELEAAKVIPCWPKPGEAAVQPAINFVPPEVAEWLSKPESCLLPPAAWPSRPPLSRVRASDKEWEAIVMAAVERKMMRKIDPSELLRDHNGVPVLNGAGGVKKLKKIGGEEKALQRFKSILVPSNSYQRHVPGDDVHLPYLGQMLMMDIDEDERVLIDSEDLTSCFNLFEVPPKWGGYFAFSKKVSARVFGGAANEEVYVGMTVVPMGWLNSVALIQSVVRRLVFGLSKVPETSELSKLKLFPEDDSVSVVYLDSYDEARKIKMGCAQVLEGKPSVRHQAFVDTCNSLKLPLNQAKSLVGAVQGILQGGELDGARGAFEASRDKKLSIASLAMALLGSGRATEFELRRFAGKAIFAMSFRRPTLAYLEQIFVDMGKCQGGQVTLDRRIMDEVIFVFALLPMMVMNLRARFDQEVTITDASPTDTHDA